MLNGPGASNPRPVLPYLSGFLDCFQEAGSIFEAMAVLALHLPERIGRVPTGCQELRLTLHGAPCLCRSISRTSFLKVVHSAQFGFTMAYCPLRRDTHPRATRIEWRRRCCSQRCRDQRDTGPETSWVPAHPVGTICHHQWQSMVDFCDYDNHSVLFKNCFWFDISIDSLITY